MGDVISYLKWRGDIAFTERVFTEADNLVLSLLVYNDFSSIFEKHEKITIEDAAKEYFEDKKPTDKCEQIFWEMSFSRRFQKAILGGYIDVLDDNTQFAAIPKAVKRYRLLVYIFCVSVMIILLSHYKMLTASANIAIGCILLIYAFSKFRLFMTRNMRLLLRFLWMLVGVFSFLTGIISIVTPLEIFRQKVMVIGTFIILYGTGKILMDMYKKTQKED